MQNVIRSDEVLILETSAFTYLGDQTALSTMMIKPNIRPHSPTDATPQFLLY